MTSLYDPNYPHLIEIPVSRVAQLFSDDESKGSDGRAGSFLMERDGGPLLVTTISDDPSRPFEKPIAVYRDTSGFEPSDIYDLDGCAHLTTGYDPMLAVGAVRFHFFDRDTAMLFKLSFGGVA